MSDALNTLRNYVKSKKDFTEDDERIIFQDQCYAKNIKTTYVIYGTGKDEKPKDYYTLECLAFLIKNRNLQHSLYVKNAGTRNISVVSRPDRKELLSYLDGEIETTGSIDKNAPLEITMQRPQVYAKTGLNNLSSGAGGFGAGTTTMPSIMNSSSSLMSNSINATSNFSLNNNNKRIFPDPDDPHGTSAKKISLEYTDHHQNDIEMTNAASLAESKASAAATAAAIVKSDFLGRIAKKFEENQSKTGSITENIVPLSESLTLEKIASIKAKKQAQKRKQVSSMGVDLIDEDLMDAASAAAQASGSAASNNTSRISHLDEMMLHSGAGATSSRINMDFASSMEGLVNDESSAVMRELLQRECVNRTRKSVLQSSGKQFEKDINAFLQLMKAKEDGGSGLIQDLNGGGTALVNTQLGSGANGAHMMQSQTANSAQKGRALGYNRFDQERYGAKDETGGFSIDTKLTYQPNGGTISLTPAHNNPSSTPAHNLTTSDNNKSNKNVPLQTASLSTSSNTQLTQQKTNIIPRPPSPHSLNTNPNNNQTQKSRKSPIIIIPNINSSLITMMNALDILQDLKYVSTEDKRKSQQGTNQNAPKDCEIITHKKEDGKNQQFKIVDNINKMLPQDWDRVVAVFAQGPQWQFKGWPFGTTNPPNPGDIFSKVKGFHLKMYGNPVDPNISKWSVTVIELDPHKRHLDRARLLSLWDELDRFIVKNKPYLSG